MSSTGVPQETERRGLRVLMITTSFPRFVGDASGAFVDRLARGLVAAGDAVTIVTPASPGAAGDEWVEGVRILRVGDPAAGLAQVPGGILPGLLRRPWRALRIPSMLRSLEHKAREQASWADVIHGHWAFPGGWIAVRAGSAAGKPSVVTVHGADLNSLSRVPGLRGKVRWTLDRATRVLAVSRAMLSAALAAGADVGRSALLPLGVDTDSSIGGSAAVADFARLPGLKLLAVGSLTRRKGHDILLRAIAELGDKWIVSVSIVGEGPARKSLEELARRLRVSGSVTFVGNVPPPEVRGWMSACDIFVMPSRAEGLGLVCVEAMAAGCPVIASDIPGPRELLDGTGAGILVMPDDHRDLARAIDRLAGDASLRRHLGEEGQRRVILEGRTLSESTARHRELYRQICQEDA